MHIAACLCSRLTLLSSLLLYSPQMFRPYVISLVPGLVSLNGRPVTDQERELAAAIMTNPGDCLLVESLEISTVNCHYCHSSITGNV